MRPGLRFGPGLVAGVGLALALVVAACSSGGSISGAPGGSTPPAGSDHGPIPVLGTENFYADLLRQVGGRQVAATSLLNNPNADPHTFEASISAATVVADARLVIVNGLGYDDFVTELLVASPDPTRVVIDVQKLLGLPADVNAHVWYDPATMVAVARATATALSSIEPAAAPAFETRLAAYLASLGPIRDRIAAIRAADAGAPIAMTEPVAGYLVRALGLVDLTPPGFEKAIEAGTDPAPLDVATMHDLLTGRRVRLLLFNNQVTTPVTDELRALAMSSGVPVVGVAETIPAAESTFQAWQLAQLGAIETALAAGRP